MSVSRRNFLLGAGASVLAAPGIVGLAARKRGVETDTVRQDSLWTAEIPLMPPQPRFQGERQVDLAIVGGGYTGLSCAYYAKLFRPDWTVIVLESHQIGSGASSRNTGVVQARHLGIDDHDMPQRGLNRLRNFIDTQGIECDFSPASTLNLFHTKQAATDARASLTPGEKWISPEELREHAGSNYYTGAVDSPDFFKIHPAKLVAGHAKAALTVGVELFEHSPVLNISSGKPASLSTPQGRIKARNVCIATNAYTPRLGMLEYKMYPLHQYSFATRKLSTEEIHKFGLDRWDLRFEPRMLPVTFSLTPSGRFFVRMVLGYASHDSTQWHDIEGAKRLATQLFEQRYPGITDIGLTNGWHGVTGHTTLMKSIAGPIGDGNIHVSVAYNGFGIMPSHNFGYLTACRITGNADEDLRYLTGVSGQLPVPGDFYRSLMLKPFMKLMTPV